MNKKIIPCRVRDEYVEGAGVVAGAAGSGGDAVLQLEFGPRWEELVKYVTFRDALKENPVTVILTTDMIERIMVPIGQGQGRTAQGGGPHTEQEKECEECSCREILVYNVPIPAKAKAVAGQMGVVVQGYAVAEDGKKVEGAVMTANAYYKILPADYAPVEDGSVTPTLSQQLQGQIEAIKKDIVGAAGASDAKEAAQRAAERAEEARAGAETQAQAAERSAQAAAGSAGEAGAAAGEAKAARSEAQAAAAESEAARRKAEEAGKAAELAKAAGEAARDAARLAQVGAEEAENRGKGYRDEALAARDAAREARTGAEEAKEAALEAKEEAQECRTQAWIERVLAQDAGAGAEEARDHARLFRSEAQTAQKESQEARDEAVLALQWIRMEQGDIREEQKEVREIGEEVRRARDETVKARDETLSARDGAAASEEKAVIAAEEAAKSAAIAKAIAGGDVVTTPELEEALKEISEDMLTRQEAKGYVEDHDKDPLAHEGVFPRIGFVAGERVRESWRPGYGLGGGGEEGGENGVVLELEDYTGTKDITAIVSGKEYDSKNLGTDGVESPNGTIIIKKLEEENHG